MKELVAYRKHYNVFIKWEEEPMQISAEWWEILCKILKDKDCPSFVDINDWLYNKFQIEKVILFEQTKTAEELSAEALLLKFTKDENGRYPDWSI